MTARVLSQEANAQLIGRSPLADLLSPPDGIVARFRHYCARYGFTHALLSFAGRHSFSLWQWIGPATTRPYLRRWLASDGPKILNLGGGIVLSNRWLTADIVPRADVYMSVVEPLPLPDACLDAVFSEEVIEHIPLERGRGMLRECWRVLRPGGLLRLTTPSLDYFARRALESAENAVEVNDIFYKHEHRHIYAEAELQRELLDAGFAGLRASSYRDPASCLGFLDSHPARHTFAPAEWSQYWECRKPEASRDASSGQLR